MVELDAFKKYLKKTNWAKSTQDIYFSALYNYSRKYNIVSIENIKQWRIYLISHNKASTVNLFIRGMNVYLEWSHFKYHIKAIPIQTATRLDRIFGERDYVHLCSSLLKDKNYIWFLYIRLAATVGGRPSDILVITGLDIQNGYRDILSKGKWRTIYIPKSVQKEFKQLFPTLPVGSLWYREDEVPFTLKYVREHIKGLARKYGLNPDLFYPYAFRHYFGKNFIKNKGDITLLKDLLGHSNIQTTSIYTRRTMAEQKNAVDRIVKW